MPRMFALAVLALSICGCSQSAQTAWLTGNQQTAEALAGARAAAALEDSCGGVAASPAAHARLERVGSRVARGPSTSAPWQFRLLCSDKPNAFALPANRVYLTRGLYDRIGNDDALLAAAIAHEMAHLQARDCFKPSCRSPEEGLGREQSADRQAVAYLREAGYPADSLPRLLQLIADVQPDGWAGARVRYIHSIH